MPSIEPSPSVAEPGPNERVYAVVFGRVWLAALGAVSGTRRWTVTATDPVRGEILVEARGLLSKRTRPARITIALDPLGLTRVDATFLRESGGRAEEVEPRQIARFFRRLESLLRRDSRA
jgi:hypothetical protein